MTYGLRQEFHRFGAAVRAFGMSAPAQTSYRYPQIDVPNASRTFARGINAHGDILGDYVDADGVGHDFLLRNGVFTNIAYPGGASGG
jgi:hypothetical protein